eukprot:10005243-Alexandrium_andersonii.AAC.1
MVCLQTPQTDLAGAAQKECYDSLKHFLKPEALDAGARQMDYELQDNALGSEEAWRTTAEARWRWE